MAKLHPSTRDAVRQGAIDSARLVLPIVQRGGMSGAPAPPAALLDVGCGEGHWLDAAHELWPETSCCGVDLDAPVSGSTITYWNAEGGTPLPLYHRFADVDLADPQGVQARWPLVLCLEVAEHLSSEGGDHLIAELCRVSERVAFSAAIPGQGGDGHVNEQWPAYWSARFNAHGFFLTDPYRYSGFWEDKRIEPWYRQNLLMAQPATLSGSGRVGGPLSNMIPPRALVHPDTWAHYRGVAAP